MRIFLLVFILLFSAPAFAEDPAPQDGPAQTEGAAADGQGIGAGTIPVSGTVAVVCLDPASGAETEIQAEIWHLHSISCPEGQTAFIRSPGEVPTVQGPAPLSDEPSEEHDNAEVRDAPSEPE